MIRLFFGCVLLLLHAGVAHHELVCPESLHDVGQVSSGNVLAHRFTLVNRGAPHRGDRGQTRLRLCSASPDQPTLRPGEQAA